MCLAEHEMKRRRDEERRQAIMEERLVGD